MNWMVVIAFSLAVINLIAVVILVKVFINERDFLFGYMKGVEKHLRDLWDRFNSFTEGNRR